MQLLRTLAAVVAAHARTAEDASSVHLELERGAPFCANPACALHARLLDAQVEGGPVRIAAARTTN